MPTTTSSDHTILICGPSWIGDMVMSHSLVQVLRQNHPNSRIDMLSPVWPRPIARFMAEIDTVFTLPFSHGELSIKQRRNFGQSLQAFHYDQCYILPNSLKSTLVPWFAGISQRIGWKAEGRSILLTDARKIDKQQLPLMHQRYAALGMPRDADASNAPWPQLQTDHTEIRSQANKLQLIDNKHVIGLAPGAEFGPSKQWPLQNFITLAQELATTGHPLLLFGSTNDTQICARIEREVRASVTDVHIKNLAGETTLAQLMHLLPICSALVCHDSGVMHMAAALKVPLVALYGSTSPEHTPPLSHQHTVLYKRLDCSPCFKRACPLQHHQCMKDIHPHEVMEALYRVTASANHAHGVKNIR